MTRVVKLGGRAQGDPALPGLLARAALRDEICVVHGGGDELSALMRQMGREPTFVNGRRVTTTEDIDLVRMVLSGVVNKRLVSALVGAGVRALGISGEDAGLLQADLFDDGALGAVGEPRAVDASVLRSLLAAGLVPVLSPLARGPSGDALNVNGDDAAAAVATALGADELLLVADVPGVLDESGVMIRELGYSDADHLVSSGVATGGMRAKLDAALRAVHSGVRRVRISDITAIADADRGTAIVLSPSSV